MNKDKMILKDKTEIELEVGASLSDIKVITASKADMIDVWNKMTVDNLSSVQILNGAGLVCGTYEDLVLISETSAEQADGTILTSFCIREKTDIEKRVDVLDGAVGDFGAVTSALADQIGGEV